MTAPTQLTLDELLSTKPAPDDMTIGELRQQLAERFGNDYRLNFDASAYMSARGIRHQLQRLDQQQVFAPGEMFDHATLSGHPRALLAMAVLLKLVSRCDPNLDPDEDALAAKPARDWSKIPAGSASSEGATSQSSPRLGRVYSTTISAPQKGDDNAPSGPRSH